MANYQIGNIMLNFKVQSNNISNSINKVIKSFSKLNNINLSGIKSNFNSLTQAIKPFLDEIKSAEPALKSFGKSLDFKKTYYEIEKLNEKLKTIRSKSSTSQIIDTKKIEQANAKLGITNQKLEQAKLKTQALADKNTQNALKIEQANLKIQKANNQLTISNEKLKKIQNSGKKTDNIFNKVFNLGRIYFWINYTKRAAQAIGNMITSAIDFDETLNKFQVSMGKYYSQSIRFVNSLTHAFNLSTESIMNYQSTFKNMLDAIGGLEEGGISYQLSETLTRMAIDYASLFNVSIDSAMQQFQSTLSGQIRSIRTTSGYDVSEASIYALYQSIGGTKTMRQLDQVEKRLLRILAVQQQMSNTGAVDDFAKTINNSANVLKQMSETWKEIGRWVGQLVKNYLAPFLEKFLGFSIALREIVKAMNITRGYQYENAGKGGMFGAIEESAESAEEAVESLKSVLLGFDKLNILGSNTPLGGLIPDYGLITDQISEYSSKLDEIKNKSNGIAESILTTLGFQKVVNEYVDEQGNKVQNIYYIVNETGKALGDLISLIGSIGVGLGSLLAIKAFPTMAENASKLGGKIVDIFKNLNSTQLIIAGIVALFTYLYTTNEDFKKSIDNLLKTLGEALLPVMQAIMLVIDAIMSIVNTIINEIVEILVPIIDAISPVIKTIGDVITSLLPIIKVVADIISGVVIIALETIFTGVQPIIGAVHVIIDLMSVGLIGGLNIIKNLIGIIAKTFETIGEFLKTLFSGDWASFGEKIKEIWKGVGKSIKATFVGVINGIITAFANFINNFANKINDLISALSGIWTWIGISEIPNIPQWNPELIPLASGGVATKPTPALIGEYAGANTNPEIVTPERLMREVFIDSMLPLVQAVVSGNNDVVRAIQENGQQPIELNGRKVSEAIYDDLRNVAIRKGNNLSFAR